MINAGNWTLILFPVAQVMAVILIVIWMYLVAGMGLQKMSPQRNWGLLSAGMLGGTLLSMLAEIIGAILLLSGFILLILFIPSLLNEVTRLADQISNIGNDIDALMRILTPYLSRPAVVITLVFSVSIAVPLIEEALKPIGLWFLARRRLTPSEGFIGGVISGAGFALFESLLNSTQLVDDTWLLVSSMRFRYNAYAYAGFRYGGVGTGKRLDTTQVSAPCWCLSGCCNPAWCLEWVGHIIGHKSDLTGTTCESDTWWGYDRLLGFGCMDSGGVDPAIGDQFPPQEKYTFYC